MKGIRVFLKHVLYPGGGGGKLPLRINYAIGSHIKLRIRGVHPLVDRTHIEHKGRKFYKDIVHI